MHLSSDQKRNFIVQILLLAWSFVLFFLGVQEKIQVLWEASFLIWFSSFSLIYAYVSRWSNHRFFPWCIRFLSLVSLGCIGGIVYLSRWPDTTSFSFLQQTSILSVWGLLLILCAQFVPQSFVRSRIYLFLWFPILYGIRISFPAIQQSCDIIIWFLGILLLVEGSIRAFRSLLLPQFVMFLPRTVPHLLFHRFDPIRSVFSSLYSSLGIDVAGASAFHFIRRAVVPLIGGLSLFLWSLSSFVLVHSHEAGLRFCFGIPDETVLAPGLHMKLPWPWGEIRTAPSSRILSMKIGHEEDGKSTEKESILWANQHAEEEFSLLMGDQVNLIAVDGTLQYQISDPRLYILSWQNPEEQLKDIAYQVLSRSCASRNLQEALSENLQELAEQVLHQIQEEVAKQSIGLTPVAFTFSALHPPVSVARDYQAVISAQIEKESSLIRAQAYRKKSIPKAETDALLMKTDAQKDALQRIAEANGKAEAFRGLYETVHRNFERYVFQRRLDVLHNNLKGIRMTIVDHTLEEEGAYLWIEE